MSKLALRVLCCVAMLATAACETVHQPAVDARSPQITFRFAGWGAAPQTFLAADEGAVTEVVERTLRIVGRPASSDGPRPPRPSEASSLPLLFASPEGRIFLSRPAGGSSGSRAFAIGEPALTCPARVEAGGATPQAAGEAALRSCFDSLHAADPVAPASCGCRLLALDDAALAPPALFDYAVGVSARLISTDLGLDVDLAATERPVPDGGRLLVLYPSPALPALVHVGPDGAAEMLLYDRTWTGRRMVEGLSRGRYRERLALERDDGARAILSVGWDPVAYAAERRRLTRWPGT